jgi:hypothetical protein
MSDLQVRSINEEITIKRPGFFKRLIWLFISPGRLMDELAEKPRVLFWMLFWPIAFVLPLVLRWPLYLDMLREQMAASSDYMESLMGIEMTPEMIEQSVSQSSVSGLITTGILMFVSAVLMALIFFAIFKIMGGKGKFKAYLSVVVHSNIIIALYSLLLIPISYLTNDLHQSIPLTSLATLGVGRRCQSRAPWAACQTGYIRDLEIRSYGHRFCRGQQIEEEYSLYSHWCRIFSRIDLWSYFNGNGSTNIELNQHINQDICWRFLR